MNAFSVLPSHLKPLLLSINQGESIRLRNIRIKLRKSRDRLRSPNLFASHLMLDLVPRMRAFIVLLLSCTSVIAADTGVRAVSIVSTNAETGVVYTTETFTRDGQTNLVRVTKRVGAEVAARSQKFYHDGEMVAVFMYWTHPNWESFTTTESSSYSVGLDFSATRDIESLIITRKRGSVLDGFSCTNGVFYPVSDSELQSHDLK